MVLTQSQKIELGTKEIAKRIREKLKKSFPNCKFSVRMDRYSGGSSISVYLMEANFNPIMDFKDIPEQAIYEKTEMQNYTREDLQKRQAKKYHQLNHYALKEEYNPNNWCNGVFLTQKGHNTLKKAVEIAEYYNYDNSNPQTDYYSVNFSFDISIGKWDKPFKIKGVKT